jgi:hypothetical protein
MSLKKAEKLQDVLCIKGSSINAESQKTPAECRMKYLNVQEVNPSLAAFVNEVSV